MKEPTLGNPQNTIAVLQKYNFIFQKKFGQNFLIDTHVLDKIIRAAEIGKDDLVLEIGPGIGTMTQYLSCAAGKVIAVEIDRALIPILEDTLDGYDNVRVINEDVLKVDIRKLVEEENEGRPIKVVANLPYYITTPIIFNLLEQRLPMERLVAMVQKEVAERMVAKPGGKDYGALSVSIQYYTEPEIAFIVPPESFIPAPNVDSAVIVCKRRTVPPVEVCDEKLFFKVVKAAFSVRRKMLSNALKNMGISSVQAAAWLERAGIDPKRRGETLSLADFASLTNCFKEVLAETEQ